MDVETIAPAYCVRNDRGLPTPLYSAPPPGIRPSCAERMRARRPQAACARWCASYPVLALLPRSGGRA